jgi:hypothetical protein
MEAAYTSKTQATPSTGIRWKDPRAESTSILYYNSGKLTLHITFLIQQHESYLSNISYGLFA